MRGLEATRRSGAVRLMRSLRDSLAPRFARQLSAQRPWEQAMGEDEFCFLRDVLAAPSPVGLEAGMSGVLLEALRPDLPPRWGVRRFKGNAGVVIDTDPEASTAADGGSKLSVMLVGHMDKIRMQARKVGSDGKVWIDSDSFLPLTLLGHPVVVYSESDTPGRYRAIRGATVEAVGAIHFADAALRAGTKGIKPEQLYLEMGINGARKKEQVSTALGIKAGDAVLLDRPIRRTLGRDAFSGAYLDNGLGCFVVAQTLRLVLGLAEPALRTLLSSVRIQFAFASHEEIGRFGSRVLAKELSPDVVIALDVNHDYVHAPGIAHANHAELTMGSGPTLSVGSIVSAALNGAIQRAAKRASIPLQLDVVGRDTGTDGMAGFLANIDGECGTLGAPGSASARTVTSSDASVGH
jgi:putative aminopeptidase FrvX